MAQQISITNSYGTITASIYYKSTASSSWTWAKNLSGTGTQTYSVSDGMKGYLWKVNMTCSMSTGSTFQDWAYSIQGTTGTVKSQSWDTTEKYSSGFSVYSKNATFTVEKITSVLVLVKTSPVDSDLSATIGSGASGYGYYNIGDIASFKTSTSNPSKYKWNKWTNNKDSTTLTATFPSWTVTKAIEWTANWSLQSYTISVSSDGNGTCKSNISSCIYGGSATFSVSKVNDGYEFDHWEWLGGLKTSEENPLVLTVTSSIVMKGYFKKKKYTINTSVSPASSGTITGETTVEHGGNTELTAKPNEGYEFNAWSTGSKGETLTLSNITSNKNIVAKFKAITYKVLYDVETNGGVWTTSKYDSAFVKTYGVGKEIQENIPYKKGWEFLGWSKNKDETEKSKCMGPKYIAGDSDLGYKKDEEATIYAIFKPIEHKIVRSYYNINTSTWVNDNEDLSVNISNAIPYLVQSPVDKPKGDWIFWGWHTSGISKVEPEGWRSCQGIYYDVDKSPDCEVPFEITEGYPDNINWDDPNCKIYLFGNWTITGKYVNIDGGWKKCVAYVKVNNSWEPIVDEINGTGMKVKIDGHWYNEVGRL